jgi:acetyl-CoA acetyltransferase
MRPVYVVGTGLHPFGRFPDRSLTTIGVDAVRSALADAGIGRGGFQAAYCGCVYGGVASGHKVLTALGLSGGPIVNVEAGCASGGAALAIGAADIATGRYDTVLVFGLEKMPRGMIRSSFFEPWREEAGLAATPGYFALRAQRLMRESDVRIEDLAHVSVTNHRHAVENPNAMYRKPITLEEVLASPVVCEPLRLLMLCSPNEGAAAVVLSSRPPAGGPAVRVAAVALRSHLAGNVLGEHTPLSGIDDTNVPAPTELAARAAYEEAGLGPGDVDVVELQDTDAARAILSAEELRLCPRQGGGRWIRDGGGGMGTRQPVNASGGLLSKGEPLGASALGQVVELTWQLRGACGARQVPDARSAMAHTVGRGANACVAILTR